MRTMTLGRLVDLINTTPDIRAEMQVGVINEDGDEFVPVSVWVCADEGILFIEVES